MQMLDKAHFEIDTVSGRTSDPIAA
jgi:hypothetical protein